MENNASGKVVREMNTPLNPTFEVVLMCTLNQCFEQNYLKNLVLMKFSIFAFEKNLYILHGQVLKWINWLLLMWNLMTELVECYK